MNLNERFPILRRKNDYFEIVNFDMLWKQESELINCFIDDKHFVYFCLTCHDKTDLNNGLSELSIIEDNIWIEPWWQPDKIPTVEWFLVKNVEEIEYAIRCDQLFTCAILNDKSDLLQHDFVISSTEDDIGLTVYILAHNEYEFTNKVVPKLRQVNSNLRIEI